MATNCTLCGYVNIVRKVWIIETDHVGQDILCYVTLFYVAVVLYVEVEMYKEENKKEN